MKVIERVEIKTEFADTARLHEHPYPTHTRSTGTIHLTDILRKIAIQTGILDDEEQADEMPLRMFLGMAWEQMCVRLYPNIWWQPGEVERDGVVGSPDGYSIDPTRGYETVIEEFKYTSKSLRVKGGSAGSMKDITKETLWVWQVGSYLAMHPDRPTLVRFHICWANGSYDYPLHPVYIRYLIRFTDDEVNNIWRMVVANKGLCDAKD